MNTITKSILQTVADNINTATGKPHATYVKSGDKLLAQIGNYHLSGAYGGFALHQMANESGGIRDVFGNGHMTKRDLYNRMHVFLRGLESTQS